jgi:hypothetical protein
MVKQNAMPLDENYVSRFGAKSLTPSRKTQRFQTHSRRNVCFFSHISPQPTQHMVRTKQERKPTRDSPTFCSPKGTLR